MGKLINLEDDRVKVLESEQYLSITKKETVNGCHIKQLLFLVNFMCNDLENFQYKLNLMSKNKIHINTYFNLALLAKKKGLSNHAIALFEGLTKELRKTYVRDQRN